MANEKKDYFFKGYHFATEEELLEAKKEYEAVEYLKSKTDLNNIEMVVRLYNKTIEKKMISTLVGLDFLKELRDIVVKNDFISEAKLAPLPDIKPKVVKKVKKTPTKEQVLKQKNTTLSMVIVALAIIIVGMFVIVLTGKSSPLAVVYEKNIINTYASWEEELSKREDELREKFYYLEQSQAELEEKETVIDKKLELLRQNGVDISDIENK